MEENKGNNPTILDSSRSSDNIPTGWRVLSKDEDRLASDLYWSRSCIGWILIGEYRVDYANEPGNKWHAIRQVDRATEFYLVEGCHYKLPNGSYIRITDKGFEVATA
jgi:hypothetical protein